MKKYIIALLGISILSLNSCSEKLQDETPDPQTEDGAIKLGGITTRANGDVYPNLYFQAVSTTDPTDIYIAETPISASSGLYDGTPQWLTFTNGSPYYPLGNYEIQMFAYTGPLNGAGRIPLTSGTNLTNDALISNYGYRSNDLTTPTPEGEGTPGSSRIPGEILQFRHIMSKITVNIRVDSTETPAFVDPPPTNIQLGLEGLYATGTYGLTDKAPQNGTETSAPFPQNLSGEYVLQKGENFVVPVKENLDDLTIRYLEVDDYKATDDDLANLTMTKQSGLTNAILAPGYAYTLTLLFNRLGIQGIEIILVEWDAEEVENEDISYDPHPLALDLGDYDNTDTDKITKVVLWSDDGKQYVGGPDENGDIGFVNLPTGNVDSVALYTDYGMLIAMAPDSYTFDANGNSELVLELSIGGMRLLNPNSTNSENNPYLLYTPVQVLNMEKDLTASYRQMDNINIDRLNFSGDIPNFPFEIFGGYFDGNGYNIDNLLMKGPGLIKRNEGTIKNLRIASGRINASGENVAGSICAVNANIIVACINEARITNALNLVGGICGQNEQTGELIACVNTGNIESGTTIGGLVGENQNTATNAILACINTGMLTKDGTNLGGIIGTSTSSGNVVIRNSFWLVGSAAKVIGGTEFSVGTSVNVGTDEVASLSPEKLRDLVGGGTNTAPTLQLLNAGLGMSSWGAEYEYILNQNITGIVWPVPVKK